MRAQGEPEAATVRPKTKDDRGHHTESIRKLAFQGRLDILLEIKFSGASEQGYTMFYVNSQQMIKSISAGWS